MNTQPSIVFIGAGRLATNLSVALQSVGCDVKQVYSRTEASARELAERLHCDWTCSAETIITDAQYYIYALTDTALPCLAAATIGGSDAIHLHTAGSMDKAVFANKQRFGVLYPFQSFSKEQLVDFTHIPILIEGSDESVTKDVTDLAKRLSDRVYVADLEHRQRLHLAGVLANNFTNCLYALAQEQLQKAELPFDILLPLIEQTAQRVKTIDPRKAQTGPAVRHDKNVMNKHLGLLSDDKDLQTLYKIFSQNIIDHEK